MPHLEESPKEVDVALQLLDIVTPRINAQPSDETVVREITQTDHLNKRLLTTFLERMNMIATANDKSKDDEYTDEFED